MFREVYNDLVIKKQKPASCNVVRYNKVMSVLLLVVPLLIVIGSDGGSSP